jgi:hypothetical protein
MTKPSFLIILSVFVPARRSGWENILSPEGLVPDGFIVILWLLLLNHDVMISPVLPHRSATANTMALILACRFLIYRCTYYNHERNGLQHFQMEGCQPIKRLKDKKMTK